MEHDAGEIWEVTREVAREAVDAAGADGRLSGIGITNQRETVVGVGPRQRRAAPPRDRVAGPAHGGRCDELRDAGHEELVRERTGLVLDPYFSGTKIEWLLREGGVPERRGLLGTIDSWLVCKLTGEHVTDPRTRRARSCSTSASGAGTPELCDLLGRDPGSLPEPASSAHVYGRDVRSAAGARGRHRGRPAGGALRAGMPRAGAAKCTYGTGQLRAGERGRGAPCRPRGCSRRSPGASATA